MEEAAADRFRRGREVNEVTRDATEAIISRLERIEDQVSRANSRGSIWGGPKVSGDWSALN